MITLKNVSYTYPHQSEPALRNISLHVGRGEAVLLTGGSGCGKSTLGRIVNGLIPEHFSGTLSGQVLVDGKESGEVAFHDLTRIVGSLFQDPEQQFLSTTVNDELRTALEWRGLSAQEIDEALNPVIDRLGLRSKLEDSLFTLSEGEKQKVVLASVLALKPRVLMLDEPTANLDPGAVAELRDILMELKREGMTLVIFDHRLYWLEPLVDHVGILEEGCLVETGGFQTLEKHRDRFGLRAARSERLALPTDTDFLGGATPPAEPNRKDEFLIENLTFSYPRKEPLFENLSVCFPAGKITVLCGGNGCGKTTLARLMIGLEKPSAGGFHLHGEPLAGRDLLRHGSLVLQNTELQLYMRSVEEELTSAADAVGTPLDVDKVLENFQLSDTRSRHPQSLSGGQRQRLVVACALLKKPDLLILDEPTSGLDGRNMRLLAGQVRAAAAHGAAVIVITHDHELINECCDSILNLKGDV